MFTIDELVFHNSFQNPTIWFGVWLEARSVILEVDETHVHVNPAGSYSDTVRLLPVYLRQSRNVRFRSMTVRPMRVNDK